MNPPLPGRLPPMTSDLRSTINYFSKGGHCDPVPLPEEDAKPDCPDFGAKLRRFDKESWQCTVNCGWYHDDEYPNLKPREEDAKTEGEMKSPKGYDFESINDFVHGDVHFEELQGALLGCASSLAESRAEVENWIEREATICPEDVGFEEYITALREENKRLREGLTYIGHGYTQGSSDMKRKARETLGLSAAPENQGEGGEG